MSTPSEDKALRDLESPNAKTLFDKIDELRTIGVGGLVELPQLIVCGDQSSGKSSVLEAISRVRFPARTVICTRFAIEVILRRSPEPKFRVSIEPGESQTDEEEIQRLREFSLESLPDSSDDAPFEDLIEKAQEWMHIDSSSESFTGFSDDILRIEISGPEKPELTLVDLPGMYRSKSEEQSSEGIKFVQNITERYMKNERSIILAVLTAKSNYTNQSILDKAEEFDPDFGRTLAIVTAPDMLSAGSAEENLYLQYIRNEKKPMKLGWHVLRNRGYEQRNSSDDERDELEKKFFETGKWNSLSREIVGIKSLRLRLSVILFDHVRRNFPGLVRDIQSKIASHKHNLARLGASRSTLQEQRSFLVDISNKFTTIVDQGLKGHYEKPFFNEKDENSMNGDNRRRLRAVIWKLNEFFVDAITVRGCRREIIEVESDANSFANIGRPGFKNYMECWIPERISLLDLIKETMEEAQDKHGLEFPGNSNPLLVRELFRQQSSPWELIAKLHIETACDAVDQFAGSALRFLTDDYTFQTIFNNIVAPELEKLRFSVLEKLNELTSHSKYGYPLPVKKNYPADIERRRMFRRVQALKDRRREQKVQDEGHTKLPFEAQLDKAAMEMLRRGDEMAAVETIDQATVYYEVSSSRVQVSIIGRR